MKVRDRIDVIADLCLGAMYADRRFNAPERRALEALLCDLMVQPELPPELELRISDFHPEEFDLRSTARDFLGDPPMSRRRLLELVSKLCMADGVLDLGEDDYLHLLAQALDMEPTEYDDIVLDYEVQHVV